MSTYYVEFTAYMNERIRPEGFPKQVKMMEIFENIQSTHHLQARVNQRFVELATSAGLIAMKDPNAITDLGVITFEKRRFIPWNMFSHMELRVEIIAPPPAIQDEIVPNESEPKQEGSVN